MFIVSTFLIFNIVGILGAWQPDIDINRVRIVNNNKPHRRPSPRSPHSRRSIFTQKFSNYDNDYHSSGFGKLRSEIQLVSDPPTAKPKALKVHQPKEDPRLFYQSDTYIKEVNRNSLNNEVTAIYPAVRDIVRGGDYYHRRSHFARLKGINTNEVLNDDTLLCVTCPHDRTLIARPGSDRVMLQHPHLSSCHGYRIPREVKFISMYGPKFGSLLQKGSYRILGQIKYKNKMLKYCHMNVDVLIQTCALPKYLIADCKDENKTCSFTCRDRKSELHGPSKLSCGDDMMWNGQLPTCTAQSWCESLPPPSHGRISCKGNTVNNGGMADGATCRIKCARGWKSNTRSTAMCRKGVWSHDFLCTHD